VCRGRRKAEGLGEGRAGGKGKVGGGEVDGEVVVEGGFEICRPV